MAEFTCLGGSSKVKKIIFVATGLGAATLVLGLGVCYVIRHYREPNETNETEGENNSEEDETESEEDNSEESPPPSYEDAVNNAEIGRRYGHTDYEDHYPTRIEAPPPCEEAVNDDQMFNDDDDSDDPPIDHT